MTPPPPSWAATCGFPSCWLPLARSRCSTRRAERLPPAPPPTSASCTFVSSVTEPSLEEIASAADHPKVFQLYIHGDWGWVEEMVARIKDAGYIGLCITVDTAHYSRRERPMLTRWTPPTRRRSYDPVHSASVTWDTVDKIKSLAGLPFMLKGHSHSRGREEGSRTRRRRRMGIQPRRQAARSRSGNDGYARRGGGSG